MQTTASLLCCLPSMLFLAELVPFSARNQHSSAQSMFPERPRAGAGGSMVGASLACLSGVHGDNGVHQQVSVKSVFYTMLLSVSCAPTPPGPSQLRPVDMRYR